MNEKLDKYMSEQPEWVMDEIGSILLNVANSNNICKCKHCEDDRGSEGGEDQSEISDESGKVEWLDDSIYKNDVDMEIRDVQSNIKN